MKTIEATYRIVTPMFIGGADGKPSDGIRPPSFKGALRFWWRALNWGRFYQENHGNEENAFKGLHGEEARLFGRAVKDGKGGQGVFLLSIDQPVHVSEEKQWPTSKPVGESGFIGMGIWESGSKDNFKPHKSAIYSNDPFTVKLMLRKNCDSKDCEQLSNALKAVGLFGGLGSRSRRGFGSICLDALNGESFVSTNKESYQQQIQALIGSLDECELMAPFTAISIWSRIGMLKSLQHNAKDAHKQAAKLFYKVRGMKADVRGTKKRGFGQPLPLKPMKKEYDQRRASPLFFHIHPIGQQFVCSHIFMPAQFLPHEGYDMGFFDGVSIYMNSLQEVSL